MNSDLNLNAYRDTKQVQIYANHDFIYPAEDLIFSEFHDLLGKSVVLDLGVGGGRTTKRLHPLCKYYLGIDYSIEMVQACKAKFGHTIDIINFDARHILQLDKNFDFVFFSFNGIDYMGNDDRLKLLKDLYQILNPGGLFFFSSHSLSFFPFKDDYINRKNAHINIFDAKARGWELLVDYASDFICYYVDPRLQVILLEAMGFEVIAIMDSSGKSINLFAPDREQYMFHYLTRKK